MGKLPYLQYLKQNILTHFWYKYEEIWEYISINYNQVLLIHMMLSKILCTLYGDVQQQLISLTPGLIMHTPG